MDHEGRKPLKVIGSDCSLIASHLKESLSDADLWAFQSFDLRSTRAIHEGCSCPNHGTSQCTCGLIVLLVYRPESGPLTLTLDGRDEKTFVYLTDEMGDPLHTPTGKAIIKVIDEVAKTFSHQNALI